MLGGAEHLSGSATCAAAAAAPQAAVRVSGLELGGLVGSLIAGRLSDYLIAKDKSGTGGNVGKRVQVREQHTGW
jgi:predicted lipid-binding transport protein (Tim44 family)